MKLGLGTAQFGLDYGVSNRSGKTPASEVAAILREATAYGIEVLDTAPLYGDSEAAIGLALAGSDRFRIVTKTPAFGRRAIDAEDAQHLRDTFLQSLHKLGLRSVYGLLVHHGEDLLTRNGELLFEAASALKREGFVQKIGASVYSGEQIEAILGRFPVDLIQLPVNILDQRLVANGHLGRLKAAGIEIHARSVFLQGLLLMPPSMLPAYFDPVRAQLHRLREEIAAIGLKPVEAALGFVLGIEEIDVVLCGINDVAQLLEICGAAAKHADVSRLHHHAIHDAAILDPSRWPATLH